MADDERPRAEPITDARTIRALAHPLRLKILDALAEHGPLTATQVSEYVDESPQSCSFHLRTLARYGYVEDAGGGERRNRPWKLSERTTHFQPANADPDAAAAIAATVAALDAEYQQLLRTWRRRSAQAPRVWQESTFEMSFNAWLTPEELREVATKFSAVINSARNRAKHPGAARVLLHSSGFPIGDELPEPQENKELEVDGE